MHRLPPKTDPPLGALLDERDHLMIQISLARDADLPDDARLAELRTALLNVETQIQGANKKDGPPELSRP